MDYCGPGHSSVLSRRCHSFLPDTHGLWIIAGPFSFYFFSHPDISLSPSPPNKKWLNRKCWRTTLSRHLSQAFNLSSISPSWHVHPCALPWSVIQAAAVTHGLMSWKNRERLRSQHKNRASAREHSVAGNQRKMRFRRKLLQGTREPWGAVCCLEYKTRHSVVRKMVSIKC